MSDGLVRWHSEKVMYAHTFLEASRAVQINVQRHYACPMGLKESKSMPVG